MSRNNFHYAISLANTLFDIDLTDEDTLLEIGMVAYNHIGNKNTKLIRERLRVNDGVVQLPCEADLIEAVTKDFEDFNYTSNTVLDNSSFVENYIEHRKEDKDPYYISGEFVKFRREGLILKVPRDLKWVNILYHHEDKDEEGLPYINDKEALAIAEYIAYTIKYKEALRTNNGNVMQMATNLRQQWLFHCDAARTPEYIDQNQMDLILDVQSQWGRKVHGRSYKPVM